MPPGLPPLGVDARLLAFAREGKSIDELALALHATDFHLYQRLYALHRQGVLEAAPATSAPAAQPPPGEAAGEDPQLLARLRAELLQPPRRPRLRVPQHEVARLRLPASEKYLLGRCDGSRDLRQIVQLAPAHRAGGAAGGAEVRRGADRRAE